MATDGDEPVVRKNLTVTKKSYETGRRTRGGGDEDMSPEEADALQEAASLRRRLGGAENRSDDEDQARRGGTEDVTEPVPPVDIVEDD